ncbi:MAG: IS1 family transposase [Spirochaetaceae bacterium]|nr:IS1 family transposase [Spirochaetaceae bacterium]
MNKLPTAKRAMILGMLAEGMSMRSITRIAGVSINTVTKLLSDAAAAAEAYHDATVRGIRGRRRIECDEIWSYVHCKQANVESAKSPPPEAGDAWTFTALDAESKLIISYLTGPRDGQSALEFMDDLQKRIEDRPQLSTDGLKAYREAVDEAFGGDVDFVQIIKTYGKDERADERKYSPAKCSGMEKIVVQGSPDVAKANTSYVERHNLNMRMSMRRFTRLTNAFSKKLEKHCASLALYIYHYNHVKPHGAVRTKANNQITPAMAAGIADRPATLEGLVELIDARAPAVRYARKYKPREPRAGI